MKKVAIYDLTGLDAFNYDWFLVCVPFDDKCSTLNNAYTDDCGDAVFFDGSKEEACIYFKDYCKKHNLQLVIDYDPYNTDIL